MDAAAELGRNPVSKHQIQPGYGDEEADAGRDCRTRIAKPNSQARATRTGKYLFVPLMQTSGVNIPVTNPLSRHRRDVSFFFLFSWLPSFCWGSESAY